MPMLRFYLLSHRWMVRGLGSLTLGHTTHCQPAGQNMQSSADRMNMACPSADNQQQMGLRPALE
eukprot:scaffold94168_cov15-Prasinocladus_malaysianus.AAC.1